MSSCKLLFFLAAVLAVLMSVQTQGKDLCQRPKNSFENIKHVHEYLECIKSQATTRYGKRAHPSMLGKLRPDLYTDYDINLQQQLYDALYGDN